MNALLIHPKSPEGSYWNFDSIAKRYLQNFKFLFLKFLLRFLLKLFSKELILKWNFLKIKNKATYAPLGLLTVAAMLPKKWNLKLIDLNVEDLNGEDIVWADIVFTSAMLVQKLSVKEIIARCKAENKTIVAGGPLFTSQYDQFSEVDHFVLNEAEVTLPLFLKDLEENKLKRTYASEEKPDLSKSPIPAWWLIKFKYYVALLVQFSRGCPFDCDFCEITSLFGHKVRTKTPSQFLAELQALYDMGWHDSVFFVDDNLIGNVSKAKEMLKEVAQWQKKNKYPFKILTQVSINLAKDDELIKLFVEANISKVFIGIETPNSENLTSCGKMQNVNVDMLASVKKLLENGIQVMAGFIYGFDKDDLQTCEDLIGFVQESGIVNAMPNLITALPRTRFEEKLKKENRLLGESNGGTQINAGLNFLHEKKEEIVANYHRIVKTIYSRRNYYKRIDTFLKYYKHSVKEKMLSWSNLTAFLKSIFYIGIFSRENIYYWLLIIKLITSRKKRKSFGVAIDMAISGRNFFKMTKMF